MTSPIYVSFFVAGRPIPKARPRTTRKGHTYTPKTTVAWEKQITDAAKDAMVAKELLLEKVTVELYFAGARVNSDIDNLAKAVLDACNEVVFKDDQQVDHLHIHRIQGTPGVLVEVRPSDMGYGCNRPTCTVLCSKVGVRCPWELT